LDLDEFSEFLRLIEPGINFYNSDEAQLRNEDKNLNTPLRRSELDEVEEEKEPQE